MVSENLDKSPELLRRASLDHFGEQAETSRRTPDHFPLPMSEKIDQDKLGLNIETEFTIISISKNKPGSSLLR